MTPVKTFLLASLTLLSGTVYAEAPDTFAIDKFKYSGTGCRQGSVVYNLSDDRQALTVLFDDFVVEAFDRKRVDNKVCDIDMVMDVPSGWALAISTVDTRGYAALDDEFNKGRVRSLYVFSGSRDPISVLDRTFQGPFYDDYFLRTTDEVETVEWSKCGGKRKAKIRTRIQARALPRSNGGALITVDSIDNAIQQRFALQWKRCGRNDPDDRGDPPSLRQSYTATCTSALTDNRSRTVLEEIEGGGTGFLKAGARAKAAIAAKKRCQEVRRGYPRNGAGLTCKPPLSNCEIEES